MALLAFVRLSPSGEEISSTRGFWRHPDSPGWSRCGRRWSASGCRHGPEGSATVGGLQERAKRVGAPVLGEPCVCIAAHSRCLECSSTSDLASAFGHVAGHLRCAPGEASCARFALCAEAAHRSLLTCGASFAGFTDWAFSPVGSVPPSPLRVTCRLVGVSVPTVSDADRGPVALGVKRTANVHVSPGCSISPVHSSAVRMKSDEFGPCICRWRIRIFSEPAVTVISWASRWSPVAECRG